MEGLFIKLCNMSIVAGWVILAVILLRILLRKAPRAISCFLWALVGIRLIFPIAFESEFSLIPERAILSGGTLTGQEPVTEQGAEAAHQGGNGFLITAQAADKGNPAGPIQTLIQAGSLLWLAGMAVMLLYAVITWLRLRRKVAVSMRLQDNVWICDDVKSPFILGVLRPRIYLPSDMEASGIACVTEHEKAHLRRFDHLWKPVGYLLLCVYWFQPLCWVAYILLCRDIEMACDERVVREMSEEGKKHYAETLLSCSVQRYRITACPLAFGEAGVKERVKGVLNYKKPAFWIGAAAAGLCIIAAVCFLTNPLSGEWKMGRYDLYELTAMLNEMSGSNAEIFQVYESETIPGTLLAGYRTKLNKKGYAVYGWIKDEEKGGYYWIRGYQMLGDDPIESNTIGADWGIDRSLTVVLSTEGELSHMSAQTNGEYQEVQAKKGGEDGPAMFVMEWSKLVKADSVKIQYFDENDSQLYLVNWENIPVEADWTELEGIYEESWELEEVNRIELDVMPLDDMPEGWDTSADSALPGDWDMSGGSGADSDMAADQGTGADGDLPAGPEAGAEPGAASDLGTGADSGAVRTKIPVQINNG
jgi:beta-lactamase regulating signal transducer with metallopeptidase domain